MNKFKDFTVEDGLAIQAQQLYGWKSILKPAKFDKLMLHIGAVNGKVMKDGSDVFRGVDIDCWVANNLMDKPVK